MASLEDLNTTPESNESRFRRACEYLDRVLLSSPTFSIFFVDDVIESTSMSDVEKSEAKNLSFEIGEIMCERIRLYNRLGDSELFELNSRGGMAKTCGSLAAFLEFTNEEKKSKSDFIINAPVYGNIASGGSTINNQSSPVIVRDSPTTHTTSNNSDKTAKKGLTTIQIIYWLVGIVVALATLYSYLQGL